MELKQLTKIIRFEIEDKENEIEKKERKDRIDRIKFETINADLINRLNDKFKTEKDFVNNVYPVIIDAILNNYYTKNDLYLKIKSNQHYNINSRRLIYLFSHSNLKKLNIKDYIGWSVSAMLTGGLFLPFLIDNIFKYITMNMNMTYNKIDINISDEPFTLYINLIVRNNKKNYKFLKCDPSNHKCASININYKLFLELFIPKLEKHLLSFGLDVKIKKKIHKRYDSPYNQLHYYFDINDIDIININ